MGRKKAPHKVRPRTPSRVKRRRTRGTAHPELIGLGLVALGLFLVVVLWLGWDGGAVGSRVTNGLDWLIGGARIVLPLALVAVGGLMVGRSGLVDFRPFRVGLVIASAGLLILLGANNGGELGGALDGGFERLLGASGTIILGSFAFTVGLVLLTGASLGALLRRSATAAKAAGARAAEARRAIPRPAPVSVVEPSYESVPLAPPVDGAVEYPDVVSDAPPAMPVLVDQLTDEPEWNDEPTHETAVLSLFEPPATEHAAYVLPDPSLLRRSRATEKQPQQALERTAETLVQALGHHGVEANVIGMVSGPRVTRYEIQLAPGTKVGKVTALKDDLAYALATTEIRILAPIPGKQAVGVEVPNLAPNIVTLGDIFDTLPANASPVSTWLGKDISGRCRLGRPRAHAAHPHRRHDRVGQVGLHQQHALLDPAALDARRGPDDPRRPEARRARALRVDPAPAHARRLEPEGRSRRARQRPHGDGAPLRAHERREGAHAARAEQGARRAGRGRAARTS